MYTLSNYLENNQKGEIFDNVVKYFNKVTNPDHHQIKRMVSIYMARWCENKKLYSGNPYFPLNHRVRSPITALDLLHDDLPCTEDDYKYLRAHTELLTDLIKYLKDNNL